MLLVGFKRLTVLEDVNVHPTELVTSKVYSPITFVVIELEVSPDIDMPSRFQT